MPLGPRICSSVFLMLALAWSSASAEADRYRVDYPVRTAALTSLGAELGMNYHYYGETYHRTGDGRIRYSNNYLREYIAGTSEGYVYHPRFMTFSTELKLGLSQQWLRRDENGNTGSTDSEDELIGYNVRADFLREHPLSATVEADREEHVLMGLFIDRYIALTESQRATVRWNERDLQMSATASHTETSEIGAVSESETTTNAFNTYLHHRLGRRIGTDIRYNIRSTDRYFESDSPTGSFEGETEIDTQTAVIDNSIDLTADKRARLRSTFRFHDQSNNQDFRSCYWQERLELEHTPNLHSYIMGSALRTEHETRTIDTLRGEIGADHQLYQSLRSHLDFHVRQVDYGRVVDDRYGGTARFNYRKTTPLGILSAGYAHTLDQSERSGSVATLSVFDEPLVLNSVTPVYLENPDVLRATLNVTDPTNTIAYTEGIDYEVVEQGRRTGLRILLGGALNDGDTVLVDYQIEVDGGLRYLSSNESIYVRHDFDKLVEGLSLYARHQRLDVYNVETETGQALNEYVDRSIGLRQEFGDHAVSTEYQDYRDDLGGFNQWRSQIEGNYRVNGQLRAGWNAGYTRTGYDTRDVADVEDWSRYYFAGAHLDGTIARDGYWRLEGRSQRETGRTDQTVYGVLAKMGFDWRRLSLEGGARYEQYDIFESQRDRTQLYLGLRWRLRHDSYPRGNS